MNDHLERIARRARPYVLNFDHLPEHEDYAGRLRTLQGLLSPSKLWVIAEEQTQGRPERDRVQRYNELLRLIGHIAPGGQDVL
ncbi:MAG: hypothetical protein ACRETG_02725 [Steroidobacteraceae bacterium]